MIEIENKAKCSGCSACYSACPKKCIIMEEDEEGFIYPKVNKSLCVKCGICENVCPIIKRNEERVVEQKGYLIQHKDEIIRKQSTSGGAFTGIASWVIEKGGVVFGAAYDESFMVHHTCVETKEELSKFRNSKYVQSIMGDSFSLVKEYLDSGRWVCFSGTPCQIEGLYSYLGKKYEKLVLVDVVCHGIPSPLIWKKYLECQRINENQPDNIIFRDKYYGYKYSTMSIVEDGKITYHAGSQSDPMLRAFFSDICDRPICYSCPFKKRYRVSDITIWDCFTVYKFVPDYDDDLGTTRVLCHSILGKRIVSDLEKWCNLVEVEADNLVYGVREMRESVKKNSRRDSFFEDALELPGVDFFKKYFPNNTRTLIKTSIRSVLIKTGLYKTVKRVLNTIRGF